MPASSVCCLFSLNSFLRPGVAIINAAHGEDNCSVLPGPGRTPGSSWPRPHLASSCSGLLSSNSASIIHGRSLTRFPSLALTSPAILRLDPASAEPPQPMTGQECHGPANQRPRIAGPWPRSMSRVPGLGLRSSTRPQSSDTKFS